VAVAIDVEEHAAVSVGAHRPSENICMILAA
jgi:hypothetical protein